MIDQRERFERTFDLFDMPEPALERLVARRHRKDRNRRIGTAVVALAIVAAAFGGFTRALISGRGSVPADQPPLPYQFLDGEVTMGCIWHTRASILERLERTAASLGDDKPAKLAAYRVASLMALADLDAADREFEFDLDLISTLGLTQDEADEIADQVNQAIMPGG